jgi:hypothetical protein
MMFKFHFFLHILQKNTNLENGIKQNNPRVNIFRVNTIITKTKENIRLIKTVEKKYCHSSNQLSIHIRSNLLNYL